MSEVMTVFRREFLERVRSKSFLLGTFLFPVFMGAMWIIPARVGQGGGNRTLVIVDQAPAGVGALVERGLANPQALGPARDGGDARITYTVQRVTQPIDQVRADLIRRVQSKEIDGWLYLPPDVVTTSQAQYRARNVSNFSMVSDVQRATTQAVQAARLQAAGLDAGQVAGLGRRVELATARITDKGEAESSAQSAFFLAYIVGFLMYMMIMLYGMNVLRSVLEEKTLKISEVIASSMKASHLMLGKILGVGSVALLQVAIWVAVSGVAISRSDMLSARFGIKPAWLDLLKVPLGTGLAVLGFFVLGFLLYSAMYAALGAAVNSDQEAQQFQILVMAPLIIPIALVFRIIADPLGPVATVLGMIPFTAPVAMAMRLASAPVPPMQIIGSLVLMAVTVLAVAWVAGKIYRVGILSTGKKPSLAELGRWLRAA
ncbi:MAG TPA: ABC transporter permease [Longimicrobium sp.]|nr:ABC transporter permease [Longimicrobium sp.]